MDLTKANTKKRTITLRTMLDDILWNIQWIGCNPEDTHLVNELLFGYHFITEMVLMLLSTVAFVQDTFTINSFTSYVMYFTILLQCGGKTLLLYLKKNTFLKISRTLKEEFWTADTFEEYREQFESKLIFANTIFRCYRILIITAIVMHIIFPVLFREMIVPIWLPFDKSLLKTSLIHLLSVNIMEVLTVGACTYFAIVNFDYLVGFLLNAVVMQFQLLQSVFQDMKNIEPDSNKQRIMRYVHHHRVLLEFVEDLQTLFKFPILLQISCVVFAMCVCAFLLTDSSANYIDIAKYVAYAIACFFQMFLYCMAGQVLQNESDSVAQAIYFSDWYKSYDKNLRNSVLFIIMRSKKECFLTIWLVKLDLQLFVQIVRFSFSMFTLLQNTNARK